MQAYLDRLTDTQAENFTNKVGDMFKSFPKLPSGITEFLVKIAPYLAILSAILIIIGGPFLGFIGTLGSIMDVNPMLMIWTILTVILMLAQAVLLIMAFSPLKVRLMKGWMYLFWAEVLGLIHGVLSILGMDIASVIFALIFAVIWFYVLFQMKPFYGKVAVK